MANIISMQRQWVLNGDGFDCCIFENFDLFNILFETRSSCSVKDNKSELLKAIRTGELGLTSTDWELVSEHAKVFQTLSIDIKMVSPFSSNVFKFGLMTVGP